MSGDCSMEAWSGCVELILMCWRGSRPVPRIASGHWLAAISTVSEFYFKLKISFCCDSGVFSRLSIFGDEKRIVLAGTPFAA